MGPTDAAHRSESSRGRAWRVGLVIAAVLLAGAACDGGAARRERWRELRDEWAERHDVASYAAWQGLDAQSPEGREAHVRLREARAHYEAGIAMVARGEGSPRDEFERGLAIAPMDPELYLPLARAFRARAEAHPENPYLFIRSAEYYRKFLALAPRAADVREARAELEALDPSATQLPDALTVATPVPDGSTRLATPVGAAVLLALGLVALVALARRRRGLGLEALAARHPELQPAIAYLVGTLRHELLKHRVGAVTSGVRDAERARPEQRAFVARRLYGGEPLLDAWRGHVESFERALGERFDAESSPLLARARRGLERVVRVRRGVEEGAPAAWETLRRAHAELRSVDAELEALVAGLVRTKVDDALVRGAFHAVRSELAAGAVALDGVRIEAPDPAPHVEVFRADLELVLRNLIRNAVLAVGEVQGERRVAVEVSTDLLPTGEEHVVLRIVDTSPRVPSDDALRAKRLERGLGLVAVALARYDGALVIEPAKDPFCKAIAVRFFRVYPGTESSAPVR